MIHDVSRGHEPKERQTKLCDDMLAAVDKSEHSDENDKIIIFISNEKEQRGGLVMNGYDENENGDVEAMTDLFCHLAAIMEANGKKLHILPIPQYPMGTN